MRERKLISNCMRGRGLTAKGRKETFSGVENALYLDCDGGYVNIFHIPNLPNSIIIVGKSFVSTLYFSKPEGVKEKKNLYY